MVLRVASPLFRRTTRSLTRGALSEPAITDFVLNELGLVAANLTSLNTNLMFVDSTVEVSSVTTETRYPDAVVIG